MVTAVTGVQQQKRQKHRTAAAPVAGAQNHATSSSFPWLPVLSLSLISFSSAFSICYVFPIVPNLVLDFGMVTDAREPGFYAGYISSATLVKHGDEGTPLLAAACHALSTALPPARQHDNTR
jgi:hypothetical protein